MNIPWTLFRFRAGLPSWIGNGWSRILHFPVELSGDRDPEIHVDLRTATSRYYYGFGPNGWSPFQHAATLFLGCRSPGIVRSYLSSYFNAFQPRSLAEAYFGVSDTTYPLSALSPFDPFKPWRRSGMKPPSEDKTGNKNFGPTTPERLDLETDRIVKACLSIERFGYQPDLFADGFIRGYLLADGHTTGFIVTDGVHRAAVLSAMGCGLVRAKFHRRKRRVVEKSTISLWPQVCNGYCSLETASLLFDRHLRPGPDKRRELYVGPLPQSDRGDGQI